MPTAYIELILPITADQAFDLIHDYDRRLEWDTLLQEAYLEPEFPVSAKGAISVCRGRRILGSIAIRSVYVTFDRGRIAAVKMLNRPPFFETFGASIRHFDLPDNTSKIVYKFNFTARPAFLRPILHPIMQKVLKWETGKRLKSLKTYVSVQ
ncbi:MAG: SRPBCC family protein [Saprospiraceae bacterium]|nr:SRPBCC family protein [Pyrinomonadaceae bacterium]